MKGLKVTKGIAVLLAFIGAAAAPTSLAGGWTQQYACTFNSIATTHKINGSGDTWAAANHEFIPGNCQVHTDYDPGDGDPDEGLR